jgi:hypothetical protein
MIGWKSEILFLIVVGVGFVYFENNNKTDDSRNKVKRFTLPMTIINFIALY